MTEMERTTGNAVERLRYFAGGHYAANFPHYAQAVDDLGALYQAALAIRDAPFVLVSPDSAKALGELEAAVRRVEGK